MENFLIKRHRTYDVDDTCTIARHVTLLYYVPIEWPAPARPRARASSVAGDVILRIEIDIKIAFEISNEQHSSIVFWSAFCLLLLHLHTY